MIAALAQHGGHFGARAGPDGGQGRGGIADSAAAEQPRQSPHPGDVGADVHEVQRGVVEPEDQYQGVAKVGPGGQSRGAQGPDSRSVGGR